VSRFRQANWLLAALAGISIAGLELFLPSPAVPQTTQCIVSAAAQGTPDAITIAALPCALTTNLLILTSSGANTTQTPTLQPLGLAAQVITHADGTALLVGDIGAAGYKALLTPTGSNWVLLNPASGAGGSSNLVVNSSSITGGIPNGLLFDNGGTLGNLATNSGGVLATSPSGVPSVTSSLPGSLSLPTATLTSPTITGGTLSNTQVGSPTAAPGAFTTLSASTPVGVASGGTGAATFTSGVPVLGAGTSAMTSGAKSGSTTTFGTTSGTLTNGDCVSIDGSGNLVDAGGACTTGGGGGTVTSGTIHDLGVYAATGTTISGLATANSGVLVTSASGVPSIATTLPGSLTIPSPTFSGSFVNAATSSTLGGVKPDGTTIADAAGVISLGLGNANTWTATQTFPAGSLTLAEHATQVANSVVGNATGGSASPTALAMPSCSSSTSALIWTSATGFGCNSAVGGVASFATRTGAVVPASGDYTTSQLTTNTSGSAACTGCIGEVLVFTANAQITPANNAVANVSFASQPQLTAGNWRCDGSFRIIFGTSTSLTTVRGWINTTSASAPSSLSGGYFTEWMSAVSPGSGVFSKYNLSSVYFNVSTATNVYLSVQNTFGSTVPGVDGQFQCQRIS
jgi:hypothetical protein